MSGRAALSRSRRLTAAAVSAVALLAPLALAPAASGAPSSPHSAPVAGGWRGTNPLIGDGSVYSADPATLVVDDRLYVFAGRDEAGVTQNDFIMNEWQAFSTGAPASGQWQHHPSLMRPEEVFDWATPGRAYAGQVVQGVDERYYWYVPVHQKDSTSADPFSIGVAVADDPLGPWTDHAGGPIVSQEILGNDAHNIDPTVLVEGTRVTMYWGSFGRLQQVQLSPDMKTLRGDAVEVPSPRGFFEAPWLFERGGMYYLAYAANDVRSTCTPARYHACIAYATAETPTGPWVYRGSLLDPVSSTTSHPAITEFQGEWYIAYHTADAVGGNHFRRSVAVDRLQWDDTQWPARIVPVQTTPVASPDITPKTNVAPAAASVTVSNDPIPDQYWVKALNDEIVRPNPLPPDMWGTWTPDRPAQHWIQYSWRRAVTIDASEIEFWSDAPPGTGNGVSAPAAWRLEYWTGTEWAAVPNPSGYGTSTEGAQRVEFDPVTTTRLRASFDAAPGTADPTQFSAVAVEEWRVDSVEPVALAARRD